MDGRAAGSGLDGRVRVAGAAISPADACRRVGRAVEGPDRTYEDADPRRGYVASANDNLARTRRIEQLFRAQATFGIDDFERMQHDTLAWNAEQLVPLLARLRASRPDVEDARSRLLRWDRRLTVDSDAATVYALWEPRLLRALDPTSRSYRARRRFRRPRTPPRRPRAGADGAVACVVRPQRRRRAR